MITPSLRLLLLRHAQADHPPSTSDYDRPLTARGEDDAAGMGQYLAQEGLVPTLAIVSGSCRTRATWTRVQQALPDVVPAIFDDRIYEAHQDTLMDVLRGVASASPVLMVVGHNPGMHRLALQLVGRGGRNAYGRLAHDFPPAGLAVIDFDAAGWGAVSEHAGVLERFASPQR